MPQASGLEHQNGSEKTLVGIAGMTGLPVLYAIGGGGFTHDQFTDLNLVPLQACGSRPNIGFLGTASRDCDARISRFYKCYKGRADELSHLPMTATRDQAAEWVRKLDLLYVGGGNTALMLEVWQRQGWSDVLRSAASGGLVLSGVSAGAICWFDWCLSNYGGPDFKPLRGLGLFAGSACPHYCCEPDRRQAFRGMIANGVMPPGYGFSEGCAVEMRGDTVCNEHLVDCTERSSRVERNSGGGWVEIPLAEFNQEPSQCKPPKPVRGND